MVMRSKTCLALLTLALVLSATQAQTLTESQLACSPREVEPGNPIVCFIYVRDDLQEPTSAYSESAFTVKLLTEIPDAIATASAIQRTVDPTVAQFSVTVNRGTNLRVDVEVKASGNLIRGSGFVGTALTWPPTRLGDLQCSTQTLQLRSTVTCSAPAFGDNDVAAAVRPGDVYFSEDHSEGSFRFVSGMRNLVFNFTAPNFPSMIFNDFLLRVTLSGKATVYTARLPLVVPPIRATERSVLKCVGDSIDMCLVNAADAIGPVSFNPSDFTVRVEEYDGDNGQWFDVTSKMLLRWNPTANPASRQLVVEQLRNTKVFNARVHVVCSSCAANGAPVIGSPFNFRSGVPPLAQYVSFRKCDKVFMTALNSTTCIIDVAQSVTPDLRYINIKVSGGGTVGSLDYLNASSPSSGMYFRFFAADVEERLNVYLTVTVGSEDIVRSPWKLVVYPRERSNPESEESRSARPVKIAIGFIFFGAICLCGAVAFLQRQKRIREARKAHMAKLAEEEMKANAEQERKAAAASAGTKAVEIVQVDLSAPAPAAK